jgi:integrase
MRGSIRKRKGKGGAISYSVVLDVPPKPGHTRRQRRISGLMTRKAAEKKLHDMLTKIADGRYFETSKITVQEYSDRWLAEVTHRVKPRTTKTYKRWLKDHILPRIGSLPIASIKPQHLRDVYADLLASGRKGGLKKGPGLHPQSVVHAHRTVHAMFADALEGGIVERNPAAGMNKRLPRVPHVEQRTLSEDEAKGLLSASKGSRLHTFVTLALYTGARRGELLALTWPFVDLDSGWITVAHSLADDGTLAEPKRERSRRTIVLPPAATAVLRAHKAAQASQRLAKGPLYLDQGFVFADDAGRPWKLNSHATLFKAIAKRAGLDAGVHIHTLRHTFASLALRAGVPITTLAAILGHDTAMLMRVYGHQLPSAEDTAAKALQLALAGAS